MEHFNWNKKDNGPLNKQINKVISSNMNFHTENKE